MGIDKNAIITKIDDTTLEAKIPEVVQQITVDAYLAVRKEDVVGLQQRLTDLTTARDSYAPLIVQAQADVDAILAELDKLGLKLPPDDVVVDPSAQVITP